MTPEVSFLVPSYNYGRFLHECIWSILKQKGAHNFEVIFIDDASTDDSLDQILEFRDPRIRILRHERNQGHAATINQGLREARGVFIARIDLDDRYRPGFLSTVLPILRKYPEVGLVYGNAALIDEGGSISLVTSDPVHGSQAHKGNEFVRLLCHNFISAPTAIARREAWLSCPSVPRHLAFNDWYFSLMMARPWEFYYVPETLADYRVHSSNYHAQITRNRSEETSIFWLLDRIYCEKEWDEGLEQEKRRIRSRVYASHWLDLGRKYFGMRMDQDARRCLIRAVRLRPGLLLRVDVSRWLCGTVVGRRVYETVKRAARLFRNHKPVRRES